MIKSLQSIVLIVTLLLTSIVSANEDSPNSNLQDSKHVVMLLWRGVTQAEQGFVDEMNKNDSVRITILDADKNRETLVKHIDSLEGLRPDLVYTFGTTVTLSLLGSTNAPTKFNSSGEIPVVFNIVSDPIGSKVVDSVDSSQRAQNYTGVSHIVPYEVQLNVIKELGDIRTVGILFNPLENNSQIAANTLLAVATQNGINVKRYPVQKTTNGIEKANIQSLVVEMKNDDVDLVYLPADSLLISNAKVITDIVHSAGLPTFSATESPIRNSGALVGVVSRYYYAGQFAAFKAQQILTEDTFAGDIPIETLQQFSYIVNADTANLIGYFPPVSMLKISELVRNKDVLETP